MKTFINSIFSIAPLLSSGRERLALKQSDLHTCCYQTPEPAYQEVVRSSELRRMPRLVKMGMYAALKCLQQVRTDEVDAIVVGTGLGGFSGFERFEQSMTSDGEGALSPVPFLQSLDNTVSAHLALKLQCSGYNMTYVHRGFSFESALIDAKMLLAENSTNKILVGGLDECTRNYAKMLQQAQRYGKGSSEKVPGEGATFMLLSSQKRRNTVAELKDIRVLFNPRYVVQIKDEIESLLHEQGLSVADLDLVLLGQSGDVQEDRRLTSVTDQLFVDHEKFYFKTLCGEYFTATAFAVWLVVNTMIDSSLLGMNISTFKPRHVLIANHYGNKNYSFILLSNVTL